MKPGTQRGTTIAAAPPPPSPDELARALEAYLADHPHAVLLEEGRVAFDLRTAKYARCNCGARSATLSAA